VAVADHAEDPEPYNFFPAGLPFFDPRPRPLECWAGPALDRKAAAGWPASPSPRSDLFGQSERDPWILVRPEPPDGVNRPGNGF
jgi:hypothetical protein